MDSNKKYEIAVLAEDYEAKRLKHEMLGMLNTYGKTPEERRQQTIDYHIADAEKIEAWVKLNTAKNTVT